MESRMSWEVLHECWMSSRSRMREVRTECKVRMMVMMRCCDIWRVAWWSTIGTISSDGTRVVGSRTIRSIRGKEGGQVLGCIQQGSRVSGRRCRAQRMMMMMMMSGSCSCNGCSHESRWQVSSCQWGWWWGRNSRWIRIHSRILLLPLRPSVLEPDLDLCLS